MAQRTIHGTVKDADTGETLMGATVRISDTNQGSFTNEYGFFSLKLESDTANLEVSYTGYQNLSFTISPETEIPLNLKLTSGQILDEIVVKSNSMV